METMLAPCGIDCGICSGYLREKNQCPGCMNSTETTLKHIYTCSKKICANNQGLTFCYECQKFPCYNLKKLEKRYSTQYGESPVENGILVRDFGFDAFKKSQLLKWTCQNCGQGLNVHKKTCPGCGEINPNYLK